MKKITFLLAVLSVVFLSNFNLQAQGTYDKIFTVLQTNCSGSGCHSAGANNGFSVDGSKTDVYNAIVGVDPLNDYARETLKNKLIYPGQPARSYLLRQVANCLDGDLTVDENEEDLSTAHASVPLLDDPTIELIRQWIQYGAPETGKIHNEDVIADYYANPSDHVARMTPLAPPRECEGFQVHLGPIFLNPNEEVEYFLPYDLGVDEDLEVTKIEVKMNTESHHFILYSLDSNDAASKPKGLRALGIDGLGSNFVNAWQSDDSYELPNGTAFFWDKDRLLDLNYHIFNYNSDKILPTEVYMNVYTQPKGTAEKEMKSTLITINPVTSLYIPPYDPNNPNRITTYTEEIIRNGWDSISVFMLSTHTHSWGVGYDIFRRDPNAPDKKGPMLYDGNYNFDYTQNLGRYDWEHPAVRRFDPLLPVDMKLGLVHEARYKSINAEGKEPVGCIPTVACPAPSWTNISWSFETTGEMMLIYMQYVDGTYEIPSSPLTTSACDANDPYPDADPCKKFTSINEFALNEESVNVFPNPFSGNANIVVDMPQSEKLNIEVYDMLGKRVEVIADDKYTAGQHTFNFQSAKASSNGVYLIRVTMNEKSITKKLIELQ